MCRYSLILLLISSSKLVAELVKLDEMSKQAIWKKVLDNQEIKNKIEGTLKQIDEHIKDFHVSLLTAYCRVYQPDIVFSSFIS